MTKELVAFHVKRIEILTLKTSTFIK